MESLWTMLRQIEAWWAYTLRCARSPGCESLWTWVWLGALALAVFVGLHVLRKVAGNFLAEKTERMRVAERARVADPETMSRYRLETDKLYEGAEREDVEQRIRQALEERKARDQWQRPGATGKKENG